MTPEQLKKAAAGLTALHGHLKAMKAHHDGMVTHHAAHGDMHKALSGHMDTAMAHCTKALSDAGVDGATSFNAGGSGPTSTDIRAGSTGTEAHQAKAEYVEVGKASDGTPLFKRVENTPLSSMNVDDLLSKIDARLDERDTVMLRAMFAAMNNSPELLDATKAAAGVGDRSMVITKAAAAQPVTKAADAANGGAGAPAAGATDDSKPTSELFKKGTSGDMEARLKFARTIKRMSGQDTARVQDNLSSFARH